jgi:hydroxymethylglutaryl-CoA reductase (NADPH)
MKNSFCTDNIKNTCITPEMVLNRNCENFFGAIQVPLGLAGPVVINFSSISCNDFLFPSRSSEYFLPLATTEGALVASVNRGCKATKLSGGINTYVENIGTTRAPLFKTNNLAGAKELVCFVQNNFEKIAEIATQNSKHLKLTKFEPQIIGRNVWLKFYFDTAEAMGMNMVTIACQEIGNYIEKKTKAKCLALSGNLCVDKKASWANFISGRGKKIWAEATLTKEIVKEVLKTSPKAIVEVVKNKFHLGSMASGSIGFNAHFANIVAALFLATGQDMAHVVEGSLGIVDAEVVDSGDLYFTIYLPDLMVGTVGGGTRLPTQKESLGILGFDQSNPGDSLILAQIVGTAVLAGELSLTAAIASQSLASAHLALGRGKK